MTGVREYIYIYTHIFNIRAILIYVSIFGGLLLRDVSAWHENCSLAAQANRCQCWLKGGHRPAMSDTYEEVPVEDTWPWVMKLISDRPIIYVKVRFLGNQDFEAL